MVRAGERSRETGEKGKASLRFCRATFLSSSSVVVDDWDSLKLDKGRIHHFHSFFTDDKYLSLLLLPAAGRL